MLVSIPTKATIKEYKYLKSSQKEVNINNTPKNLDEYVYNKEHHFNNIKILGGLTAIDLLFGCFFFKTKNKSTLGEALFMLCIANIAGIGLMLNNQKNKNKELNNLSKKLVLYKQNGINAII